MHFIRCALRLKRMKLYLPFFQFVSDRFNNATSELQERMMFDLTKKTTNVERISDNDNLQAKEDLKKHIIIHSKKTK